MAYQTGRARRVDSGVIELSDSEDEETGKPAGNVVAGPSSHSRYPARPLKPSSSSSSNILKASRHQAKGRTPLPLFLSSDDENEPPSRNSDAVEFVDAPSQVPTRKEDVDLLEIMDPANGEQINMPVDKQLFPDVYSTDVNQPATEEKDPLSTYVAQVLEIVADVDPDHLLALIQKHLPQYGDGVTQAVLHILFEDPTYPKVDKKGKRKRPADDLEANVKKVKLIDYTNIDRKFEGGPNYIEMAVNQLLMDFPLIPKPHIRKILASHRNFYAPTHLHFLTELEATSEKGQSLSYVPKKKASMIPVKGKGKALEDVEFEQEREWLLHNIQKRNIEKDEKVAEQLIEEEGTGVECGCCFSSYPFDKMVQCPDAHLFCKTCTIQYCETQLGSHDINLVCMDQSGCKLTFSNSELRRILPEKLIALYERLKANKEIEMAAIEGLEECPFCEFKCVIENPNEKLFRCGNDEGGCGAVSCRGCKKMDHLPKSCKEVEDDRVLDGQHAIEEAMTRALMRNCPKCQKSFIKDAGCNKMMCPNCMTLSCYVCRQVIVGYEHFNQQPNMQPYVPETGQKCPLWDSVEARHAEEVKAAAQQAKDVFRRDNPDVEDNQLKIDVPEGPQPAQPGAAANHLHPMPFNPVPVAQGYFQHAFNGALPVVGNQVPFIVPPRGRARRPVRRARRR